MRTAFLFLLAALAWAQPLKIADDAIAASATQELRSTGTPGAAIGIVVDGKLAWSHGYGTSNIETGAPVTPEMLFRLGSTTKMLTAAAVASFAAEGKLSFDDPVGKHVRGLHPAIAALTINQILSHTAGLKDEAVMNGRHDDQALGEEIRMWNETWLFTKPGRIYSYSNPGFWLSGYVAETLAGKPYADVMEERVFRVAGMEDSTLRPTMAMTRPFSQGHDATAGGQIQVLRPAPDNAANWPAGSVFSSVKDLSKFTIAMMTGRLSPKVIEALTTPHASIPGSKAHYGYGLDLDEAGGTRIWNHGGARAGYGSFIAMFPDPKAAIIVVCNRTGQNMPKTRALIARMIGADEPSADAGTADAAVNARDFSSYTGSYRNGAQSIRIAARNGKLSVDQAEVRLAGNGSLALRSADGKTTRRFVVVKGTDGRVEFLHAGGRSFARESQQ